MAAPTRVPAVEIPAAWAESVAPDDQVAQLGAIEAVDEGTDDGAAADDAAEPAEPAEALQTGQTVEVEGAVLDVQAILRAAARSQQVDEQRFLRIAWCESRWNPAARGPDGAAGLFQFAPITWAWVSAGAGHPGASPYDPVANAEAAAWLIATQGTRAWGCQ